MEGLEMVVVLAFGLAGLVVCIAIYLGKRDPQTVPYLPGIVSEFHLGRVRVSPDPSHERGADDNTQQDKKDDQQGKA